MDQPIPEQPQATIQAALQPTASAAPEPAQKAALLAGIFWMRDLFVSVLIAVIVILFLYQPVKVEGTSMMPMLIDQERIFINKFSYRFGIAQVNRGDTVVFWFPGDPSKSYIKRVIGVPGDKVEVREGVVYLNDKALDEPYVPDSYRDTTSVKAMSVPQGEYYVLGDHRSSSNDSRSWGTVPRRNVYGRAAFVYWPLEHMGMVR